MFDDHAVPKNQSQKNNMFFWFQKFSFFFIFPQQSNKIQHFQILKKTSKIQKTHFLRKNENIFFEIEKNNIFSELDFF